MTTRFEWDPAKAASDLRKHGVSFETAVRAFADSFLLASAERVEGGEVRWQALGSIGGFAVLLVVHTIRESDEDGEEIEIIRIISARRADRAERRRYEQEPRSS